MALQLGATRDAFLAAGVPEAKASAAAEELASMEVRFAGTDNRLAGIDARLGGIDARINLLVWVMGVNAAVTLAVLGSLFAVWSKLGELSGALATLAKTAH